MPMLSLQDDLAAPASSTPHAMPALPPAREFLTSAGFGGAAALAAAIIVALAALFALRRASQREQRQRDQQQRHHQEAHDASTRAAAINRIWQRLVWVVETAGIEPAAAENASLGLGPELAVELLRGLLGDAEQLGDDTLARAVSVYLDQFCLVLTQQSGSLSALSAAPTSPASEAPPAPPAKESAAEPANTPPSSTPEESPATAQKAAPSRRRRAQ
jgi:hypothetical protein